MLKRLWNHNRLLLISFILVALITVGFATRITYGLVYWTYNADAPLESWMPIGYVARSHDVERQVLIDGLNLPRGTGAIRLSLTEVAQQLDIPYEELEALIYRLLESPDSE